MIVVRLPAGTVVKMIAVAVIGAVMAALLATMGLMMKVVGMAVEEEGAEMVVKTLRLGAGQGVMTDPVAEEAVEEECKDC